ncbi:IclR family transcriptional regulator [Sphingomonas sp. MMS24-J13]|uniref:IclR family transcriptional regulator n=1 Tax=Sphingomonas sp. MMS24-J13 TaxID=3238686 RepID=UPI00384D286D
MPRRSPHGPDVRPGVQAVLLVLEIIEHLAKQESAGVTEIARALGSTKARVHRHLRTLVDTGYAVQEAVGDRYRAGPRLTVLAEMRMSENVLVKVARPIMQRLREAMGHTITLAKVTGSVANMVDALQGNGLINIGVRVGLDLPLHANAGGKLVLAFGAPEVSAEIDRLTLEAYTEHTITERGMLRAEIERVRQQGWANAPEEFVIGVNALSAPIFDKSHRLIGTLGLVNSIQFLGRRPTAEQIANVTEAAEEITRHMAVAR